MLLKYEGLSAVLLLQQHLRSLRSAGDQLIKVLSMVWQRTHATEEKFHGDCEGLLKELRRFVPEARATKAVQLMNKAIHIWRNTTTEIGQEEYIVALEESLDEAGADCSKLRSIFRRAVAALSPPCFRGDINSEDNSSSVQTTGTKRDAQRRLRKILLRCLDQLDLADSKVQPALERLKNLLSQFQELKTEGRKIGGEKHWLELELKCGLDDGKSGSLLKRVRKNIRYHCKHSRRRDNCRICTPCPHGKLRTRCIKCNPCPHGRIKRNCSDCTGCPHGNARRMCILCNACVHGRDKYKCKQCREENEVPKFVSSFLYHSMLKQYSQIQQHQMWVHLVYLGMRMVCLVSSPPT